MTTEIPTTEVRAAATGPIMIRHGDVLLRPCAALALAAGVEGEHRVRTRHGGERIVHAGRPGERLVLAEGEATGHAHVLEGLSSAVRDGARALVHVMEPARLRHEEHREVQVPPGWYEIVRQRVYTPQAPRIVQD